MNIQRACPQTCFSVCTAPGFCWLLLIFCMFSQELSCLTDESAVLVQECAGWWALTRCVQHWMDERSLMLSVSLCSKVHDVWIRGRPEPLHRISGHSWGPGNRVYHRNGKSALDSMIKTSSPKLLAFWRLIPLTQILHYFRLQTHGISRRNINLDFVFPVLKQNLCILLHVDLEHWSP